MMWEMRRVFDYNESRDMHALCSIDLAFTRTDITLTDIEDVLIRRYYDEKDANKKNDLHHDISAIRRTREILTDLSNEYRQTDNERNRRLDEAINTMGTPKKKVENETEEPDNDDDLIW